jgi:hypothetical protein
VPEVGGDEALVDVVVDDYEQVGDVVLRMLAQESRWPALQALCDRGRFEHRRWVSSAFASHIDGTAAQRRACTDGLVVATDIYTWKLLRRDMGRSIKATKRTMLRLVRGVLESKGDASDE